MRKKSNRTFGENKPNFKAEDRRQNTEDSCSTPSTSLKAGSLTTGFAQSWGLLMEDRFQMCPFKNGSSQEFLICAMSGLLIESKLWLNTQYF
jgi:hypothetical protein